MLSKSKEERETFYDVLLLKKQHEHTAYFYKEMCYLNNSCTHSFT